MGGLSCRVDDQFDLAPMLPEERIDFLAIADVHREVAVVGKASFQLLPIPRSRSFISEEHLAHVIVDSDDIEALASEVFGSFGPDQARRSRDDS